MTPTERAKLAWKIRDWVFVQDVDVYEKAVLHALAHRVDPETLECFLGMKRLATDTSMSEAKARRVIRGLEAAQFIQVERGGGSGNASTYRLLIPARNPVQRTEKTLYSVPPSTQGNPVQQFKKPGTAVQKTRYSVPGNRYRTDQEQENAPSAPTIWDLWAGLAGESKRPLLGKLIRDFGEDAVAEGVAITSAKRPADPASYLRKLLEKRKRPTDQVWRPAV